MIQSDNPSLANADALPGINLLAACVEIMLLVSAVLVFTPHLQYTSAQLMINSDELPFLLNSGEIASIVFKRTGAIPLWNPFIGTGEPLIEGLFSFVLNPLMTVPMLVNDPVQGAKFSIVLHIILIGIGGWLLGRVLWLKSAGRLLLGLFLAGSGSVAMAIGAGFFQIGLSLCYVPWIIAGTIGVLYLRQRWPVCILVVATILMMFAGTFWYVLPTAIMCIILVLTKCWRDRQHIKEISMRLGIAATLIMMLGAVRLLPLINVGLVTHLSEPLNTTYDLIDIVKSYFSATTPSINGFRYNIFAYHYTVPFWFAAVLIASSVLNRFRRPLHTETRYIIGIGVLFILCFTFWSQEGTPLLRWLYAILPILQQLRSPVRIGVMAAIWVAIIAAILFDHVVDSLLSALNRRLVVTLASGFALATLIFIAGIAVLDVMTNWDRVVTLKTTARQPPEETSLRYLRSQFPTEFLSVGTEGLFGSYAFYDTLVRSATGNPNAITNGLPPTIGSPQVVVNRPEYIIGIQESFKKQLQALNYTPVNGTLPTPGLAWLWHDSSALSYAFLVGREFLERPSNAMDRSNTEPVESFTHLVDSIHVTVTHSNPGSILVIQETCYPGWTVQINGNPAHPESINGLLGVVLPKSITPDELEVVFSYQPTLLYLGAFITITGFVGFVVFSLKLDKRLMLSVAV